jgi:hypothetical protein
MRIIFMQRRRNLFIMLKLCEDFWQCKATGYMAAFIDGMWYSNATEGKDKDSVDIIRCCGFENNHKKYLAVCADDIVYYELEELTYYA